MDMNDRERSEFSALNRLEEQISRLEAAEGGRRRFGRSLWVSGFLALGLVGFTLSPAGADVDNAIRADTATVLCGAAAPVPLEVARERPAPAETVAVREVSGEGVDCLTTDVPSFKDLQELEPTEDSLQSQGAVAIVSAATVKPMTEPAPRPLLAPGDPEPASVPSDVPAPAPAPDHPEP
jgi:hypothetical protein